MPVKKSPVKRSPAKKSPVKRAPVKRAPVKIKAKKPLKTVCLEGYKVTTNGRCIKDKKYNTFISTIPAPPPPPGPKQANPVAKISILQAYLNKKFAGKNQEFGPKPEVVKASTLLRTQYQQAKNDAAQAKYEAAARSAAYKQAWRENHLPSMKPAGPLITF
jgi:hypothetical protein